MKNINILFVGGSKRFSFAEKLIEAGKDLRSTITIYSYEMGKGLPISDVATVIQGGKFDSKKTLSDLENVIKKYSIDIAIPFHDKSISLLASLSHMVFVPTSNKELINIFSSKLRSLGFFEKYEIPFPTFSGEVPSIAKPDNGSASKGIIKFHDQSDLDEFLTGNNRSGFDMQDLVSGPEYSVDCYVAINSNFKYFAVRERLEILGGEVVKSKTVEIPSINKLCEKIININGISGALTAQFIYDERDNSYNIMEVNPRFGGGILGSWGAGVQWFHILIRDFLDLPQEKAFHKYNVLMTRSFREHFEKES